MPCQSVTRRTVVGAEIGGVLVAKYPGLAQPVSEVDGPNRAFRPLRGMSEYIEAWWVMLLVLGACDSL